MTEVKRVSEWASLALSHTARTLRKGWGVTRSPTHCGSIARALLAPSRPTQCHLATNLTKLSRGTLITSSFSSARCVPGNTVPKNKIPNDVYVCSSKQESGGPPRTNKVDRERRIKCIARHSFIWVSAVSLNEHFFGAAFHWCSDSCVSRVQHRVNVQNAKLRSVIKIRLVYFFSFCLYC